MITFRVFDSASTMLTTATITKPSAVKKIARRISNLSQLWLWSEIWLGRPSY
jgi:hypothetical protein